jgi:hypothetical protein
MSLLDLFNGGHLADNMKSPVGLLRVPGSDTPLRQLSLSGESAIFTHEQGAEPSLLEEVVR